MICNIIYRIITDISILTKYMEELINSFLKYYRLTAMEVELIKSKTQVKILKKGESFLETGKVAREIGFVTEGVLRVVFFNQEGEDITRAFIPKNHFALNIASYNSKILSEVSFKSVAHSKLLVFSEKSIIELAAGIPSWNSLIAKISLTMLTNKLKISNKMLGQDAKTRYLEFLEIYPGLANQISLSSLASYLGIKQSSLSRIRKSIT